MRSVGYWPNCSEDIPNRATSGPLAKAKKIQLGTSVRTGARSRKCVAVISRGPRGSPRVFFFSVVATTERTGLRRGREKQADACVSIPTYLHVIERENKLKVS